MASATETAALDTLKTLVERTAPKENPNYIVRSMYLKENGEPHGKDLKCAMYFGSIHYNDSPLTKDEVAALNLIQPLANGIITKNDKSTVRVSVIGKIDAVGRLEKLIIMPQGEEKNLNLLMPSIEAMALELAAQAPQAAA